MSRPDPLAAHIRRLGNHDLNELLVQLAKPTFAALVAVALARPVVPAGLVLRFERLHGLDGWTVLACTPCRRLGTVVRSRDDDPAGRPVKAAGVSRWGRRREAVAALAWANPASGARCLALAAYIRGLADPELHELLRGLPCEVFDRLLDAADRAEGTAA